MMPDKYDVAIVGAGPAGCTAAYLLSKRGYNVVLLDKERFPRNKLCGGCLTAKTIGLMNNIFNESEDSLTQKNIINFKSFRFEVRYKTKVLVNAISPLAFHFVDRWIYDAFLLRKTKEAGARVLEGEKVINIVGASKMNTDELILTTSQERSIKAKYVIAADGVNSTIRTMLFRQDRINSSGWMPNLAYCLEISPPRKGALESYEFPILSFGYLHYGYAWIFPNTDRLVVGIGGLKRKNKGLIATFNNFLSDYNLNSIVPDKVRGYPLPFGNYLLTPVYRNIFLVGDAAGLVDPMLGEGIYQAHKSAEMAANAIIDSLENRSNQNPGTTFLRMIQEHLITEFDFAKRFRWFLYNPISHVFYFRHIKLMEPNFGKLAEVIHGVRTYKWFRKVKN